MTPKEKAQELFDNYYIICQEYTEEIQCSIQAKQCALIAIDEAMLMLPYTDINTTLGKFCVKQHEYLEQVRHEIKKL